MDLSDYDAAIVYKILCHHKQCVIDDDGAAYIKNDKGYYLLMLAPDSTDCIVRKGTYETSGHASALCHKSLRSIRFAEGIQKVNGSFTSDSMLKIFIPEESYNYYRTIFSKRDVVCFNDYKGRSMAAEAIFDGSKLISVPYVECYDVPYGTTDIDSHAFRDTPIKRVTIAGSVKNVPASLFWCHKNIEEVIFCEGVETLGESLFGYCENLSNVIFPKSLKSIDGGQFFYACKQLHVVHLKENTTQIGYPNPFNDSYIRYLQIDGCIKRLTHWGKYTSGYQPFRTIIFNGGISWNESTFNSCKELEEIIFNGEYDRFAIEYNTMFERCDNLKSIKIRRKYSDLFLAHIHESKRHLITLID